jgi:hypothetical protein
MSYQAEVLLKGIGSILFLKNGLKKCCRKNEKIISEVIIMRYVQLYIARCLPNILDSLVLENIILFEDKIGRLPMWSNETESDFNCHQSLIYTLSAVYISTTR